MSAQKNNASAPTNINAISEAIKVLNTELFNNIDNAYKKNSEQLMTTMMVELTKQQAELTEIKKMLQQIQQSLVVAPKATKSKPQQIESSITTPETIVVSVKKLPKIPAQPGSYFKYRYNNDSNYMTLIDTKFASEKEKITATLSPAEKGKKDIVLTKLWAIISKLHPETKAELIANHAQMRNGGAPQTQQTTEEPDLTEDNINDTDI